MDTKLSLIDDIIRNTLEYKEARDLFARKLELNEYLEQIDYELKQLYRLSPAAFKIAKIDVIVGMTGPGAGVVEERNRTTYKGAGHDLQPSNALLLVTKPPT